MTHKLHAKIKDYYNKASWAKHQPLIALVHYLKAEVYNNRGIWRSSWFPCYNLKNIPAPGPVIVKPSKALERLKDLKSSLVYKIRNMIDLRSKISSGFHVTEKLNENTSIFYNVNLVCKKRIKIHLHLRDP